MCPIGLQSGDRGGHSIRVIPSSSIAKFRTSALLGRALSSTSIKFGLNSCANETTVGRITNVSYL